MPAQETVYKIFIASPSGLNEERKAFADVIEEYNKSDAQHRGVSFRAVGWEDTLAGIGRPQEIINEELKECDFFLLLLHNRWGSNPGENKQNATSGTEEEFNLAMDCYNDENSHMKQIVCAFKSIDSQQLADPGKQLEKVLEFKKELEEEKKLLYTSFFSKQEFQTIIRKQLGRWLLNHENETKRNEKIQVESPIIPEVTIDAEVEKIIPPTTKKDTTEIIKNAWKLANKGKLVEAEIEFSKAIIYNPNTYELLSYSSFLMRIGQLDKGIVVLNKVLEDENTSLKNKSIAYTNLGIIMKTRGDFDAAELMCKESLEINLQLENKKGMASDYGNLGVIMDIRGDVDGAQAMFEKSLEIDLELQNIEGIASNYGNLGILMRSRGDLNGAESIFKKSLDIYKQLDDKKGLATSYSNLASVLFIRRDLDNAEKMTRKSLEINEYIGDKESIAGLYSNLGNILFSRGDLKGAEEMYRIALVIHEKLLSKRGIAIQHGNIGNVLFDQGDLDGAEENFRKSLEIHKQIGRRKGIAIQYGSLGNLMSLRNDLDGALEMYYKSLKIEQQLGSKEGMANNYANIGRVMFGKNDLNESEKMYIKCLEIAKSQGFAEITKKVTENLEILKEEKKKKNS